MVSCQFLLIACKKWYQKRKHWFFVSLSNYMGIREISSIALCNYIVHIYSSWKMKKKTNWALAFQWKMFWRYEEKQIKLSRYRFPYDLINILGNCWGRQLTYEMLSFLIRINKPNRRCLNDMSLLLICLAIYLT